MQVLEKILEEIELEKKRLVFYPDCSSAFSAVQIRTIEKIEQIICKYMSIRNHMNDGWIPAKERLPEVFGKYWATIRYDDGRISEPIVVDFRGVRQKYVVDTPNGREYETWGIDSAFHGSRVIAWRPYYIPEPYRPERSDNHDGE